MSALSCFPAGGGAKLYVTAYASAGSLPASAREGAVAVITGSSINDVFASADAPASPASGNVWIWLGSDSSAPIVWNGGVTLHPRAAYRYSGSAWTLLDSYVYTGSAWVKVTLFLYDNGAELLSVFSIYTAAPSNWYVLTKESSALHIALTATATGSTNCTVTAETAIDLTDFTSVKMVLSASASFSARALFVSSSRSFGSAIAAGDIAAGTLVEKTLDVSALSGPYYVGLQLYTTANMLDIDAYIHSVLLVK